MKTITLAVALCLAAPALAAEPTAEDILKKYDAIMGPASFESETSMTATREDGSTRTYVMRFIKKDDDKFRIWFKEPASVKGQEMLRVGDNSWIYIPNLKRATRIANRDNFQGGDFNNADVLRVNYTKDYTATMGTSEVKDTYLVELKARNSETAYDAIKLWVRKNDFQPVKGPYFGTSGQMIRSATFTDSQELDKGYTRPTRIVMQNELVKARKSEMRMKSLKLNVDVPVQRFTQADLGK
jgi:outer membrane lipoprotein-sorting protein